MSWRVLQVIRSLRPETGGIAEAVRNLTPELCAAGCTMTTVSLDPADASANDVDAIVLGRATHGYGRSPEYVGWLRAHRREFDAVIVHGLWQHQGFGAWQALRGTDTPYFVFCHGMLDPWFKRAYPLKHLKKWCYWPWAEYRVLRDAAGVCFTSEEERRAARESFGLYRARELVTPLGLAAPAGDPEAQRETFLRENPALRGRRFLLFLGRIHPKKGLEDLLRAYAALREGGPDAPLLVVVGPCADRVYLDDVKALADRLGIGPAVHWLGLATGDQKWGAIRACEAFVLLSHQENFGMAVVEALACGRPVLISKRVNIWREIVEDGAGWAVQDNEAGAAEVLVQWQLMAPARRAAMAAAAQRCYAARFSAVGAAEAMVRAMRGAIAEPVPVATARSALPPIAPALAAMRGDEVRSRSDDGGTR